MEEKQVNKAFRAAYDFLMRHPPVLKTPEDYRSFSEDLNAEYRKTDDPLAIQLITAVFIYVAEQSRGEKK